MEAPAFVQVATDGAGRRISNVAMTLPAGTLVTNTDGTTTQLANPVTVFLQRVVLANKDGETLDVEADTSTTHELLYRLLQATEANLELMQEFISMIGSHE